MCEAISNIPHFFDNDTDSLPKQFLSHDLEALTTEQKKELESSVYEIVESNEHYLSSNKQAVGLISFLLTNVLNEMPINPIKFMKQIMKDDELKYELNKHMLKKGYDENTYKANDRIIDNLHRDQRGVTMKPYGDAFPPCKLSKKAGVDFALTDEYVEFYNRPNKLAKPFNSEDDEISASFKKRFDIFQ